MATMLKPITNKPITRRTTKSVRFYDIDGEALPSVTTILQIINKPALVNWAAKMERTMCLEAAADLYGDIHGTPVMNRPVFITTLDARLGKVKAAQKELEKAGEIGTQAHSLIEWNIRKQLGQAVGAEPRVSDKAQWAFMAAEDWIKSVQLEPVAIEQVVFSRIHGYAGTMDLLAWVDIGNGRQLALIDWKTGKAIYNESYIQNSAYQQALIEMGHQKPDLGIVVRLPKNETDPEFEAKEVPDREGMFRAFLHAKDLWVFMQSLKESYE